eukprot:scaffold2910_cov1090-Pavlova_lutheri.AAC.1
MPRTAPPSGVLLSVSERMFRRVRNKRGFETAVVSASDIPRRSMDRSSRNIACTSWLAGFASFRSLRPSVPFRQPIRSRACPLHGPGNSDTTGDFPKDL